jgi:hypothetical protein
MSFDVFGVVIDLVGSLAEASGGSHEHDLVQSAHVVGRDLESVWCIRVARRLAEYFSGGFSCPLTDGSTKCSPIREMKLSGWLGQAKG